LLVPDKKFLILPQAEIRFFPEVINLSWFEHMPLNSQWFSSSFFLGMLKEMGEFFYKKYRDYVFCQKQCDLNQDKWQVLYLYGGKNNQKKTIHTCPTFGKNIDLLRSVSIEPLSVIFRGFTI
jgi:hypothetical protein